MTNREFLSQIINSALDEELVEFAQAQIEKMDAANEKRRNTPSKTALANAPIMETIATEVLGTEPMTATEVAAVVEVSVQKASALLRALVNDGKAVSVDKVVTGKGKQKAYTLA